MRLGIVTFVLICINVVMEDFTLNDDFLRDFEDDIELATEFVDAVSEWIESEEESNLFYDC